MSSVREGLIQCDRSPYKKRKIGNRRGERQDDVKIRRKGASRNRREKPRTQPVLMALKKSQLC